MRGIANKKIIRMIKHLNHELEAYESNIKGKTRAEFDHFKCVKCNRIIFYYNVESNYWGYDDGLDYVQTQSDWSYLKLTCEEQMIKKLLE
jgi:hypothetical protein